jgi:hypothetical protein
MEAKLSSYRCVIGFSLTSDNHVDDQTCSVLRDSRCLRRHEEVLGSPPAAFIFTGGKFFRNGSAIRRNPQGWPRLWVNFNNLE